MFGGSTETDRLTRLISNYQPWGETKPRTTSLKTCRLLMGPEQVTWPEPLLAT